MVPLPILGFEITGFGMLVWPARAAVFGGWEGCGFGWARFLCWKCRSFGVGNAEVLVLDMKRLCCWAGISGEEGFLKWQDRLNHLPTIR